MKNKFIAFGLVVVACFFVLFLRFSIISMPDFERFARTEIYNNVFNKIKSNADKQYANLPQFKRNKMAQLAYKSYSQQNKYFLQEKIREKAKEKRAFYKNGNNYTYIFGIDSYYWLRLIDNLRKKGHIGDSIKDGQNYDELIDMPIEQSLSRSMHLILGSLIYKVFDFLKLDVDYEAGLYFIPLLFSVLLVILTFFTTKLLSQSNIAAFFATLTVNLSPLLLKRTMGEWLDTDIYSVFFPLLIFGAFLFVFKSHETIKKIIGLAVFSLSCLCYASIWQGWWYIFDLLMISGVVFVLNDYFAEEKDKTIFKSNILWLSLLFVSGILFVGLFNGRESCLSFITEPVKLVFALKEVPQDNWPNVFLTVAELKKVSPYIIALELGGLFIFFVTIAGSIYLVLFKKIIRDKDLGIGFFCLFIWLGSLYYVSLTAVRLALLLIVPLGLMFGIVFDKIISYIFKFSLKFSRKNHFLTLGCLIVAIYLFVSFYVARSIKMVSFRFPMMNDAWYSTLTFIKNDSDKDAIINSWWDYGHWFKAIAQRRVIFDGKTQNSPVAFWMAKVITTDDEAEAVGILRMLDISKNKAFDLLESYNFNHTKIINILEDIIKLSENEARVYLEEFLEKEKVDKIVSLLFSNNMPEACFIASYDMLGKMSSISHIGNWDFKKGDIWTKKSNMKPAELAEYLVKEYDYTKEDAIKLLQDLRYLNNREALGWISERDNINIETLSRKLRKDKNLMIFDNGLVVDLPNFNAYIFKGPGSDIGIPYSVVYVEDGVLKENVQENSNANFSVLLFKTEDSYNSIFLDKNLAKSIFVRMYFLEGQGLEYFSKLRHEITPEGNSVYLYKINWPQ
ncbi:MAG: STT3 domain-containing protein [Candidatus Omnitrophota bacterium]